jgi:hypothetical protein
MLESFVMSTALTGVRAKLGWAVHHFELLDSAIQKWNEPPGNSTITAKPDLPNQRHALVYLEPRPKPLEWSLSAGDYLHNLRSSLEHLVCQVVVSEGGAPAHHHAFPITVTKKAWLDNVSNRDPKRGPGPLEGITPNSPAWVLIANAQPYVGRNKAAAQATPLATLARLNNIDKHRELNVSSVTMSDTFSLNVSAEYRLLGGYLPVTGTPIEPDIEFGWLRIELIGIDHAELHIEFPVEIAFDNVPLRDFRSMFEEVKALVVAFEDLLGV